MKRSTVLTGFLGLTVVLLSGCMQGSGPYAYPGYYQPGQQQTAYVSQGHFDGMGNYRPPVQHGGQYMPGRWYRAQPGNPGPIPQEIHANRNPYSTPMGEVNWMSANGDIATASSCNHAGSC
jgi:hypothetical protein